MVPNPPNIERSLIELKSKLDAKSEVESSTPANLLPLSTELSISFRLVVEAMQEGIVILSTDDKVAYCNASFTCMMELSVDQIVGRALETVVPPDYAGKISMLIANCRTANINQKLTLTLDRKRKDLKIYITANSFTLGNVTVPFLVFTDSRTCEDNSLKNYTTTLEHEIIQYKQSEMDLIKSNAILNDIVNSTNSRIAVRDTQGKLVLINDAEANHLEKRRSEAIGKTLYELYPKNVADELFREDEIVITSGKPLRVEKKETLNGLSHIFLKNTFPLKNEKGQVYGINAVTVDITEYKKVELLLRESEQSFRAVFENTVLGIALMDEQFRITKTNRMFQQITGYTEEDLTCKSLSFFSYSNDVKTELSLLKWMKREQQGYYELEKRIICKDGGVKWVKVTGVGVYRQNSDFLCVVITVEDITKRKLVERQLDRYRANLEQLVEERTRQLKNARWSAIVGEAAGIVGQQLLLKYIFNEQ